MDNIMIGAVPCLLTTMVDITEQKILEREMEFHAQEVMQFSRSLDMAIRKLNLLSSITRHDINNQLTVLMGYLEILGMKQPDTSNDEYFRKAATAAQRISTMIQFTRTYESIGAMAPAWQEIRTLADAAAREAPLGKVILKNDLPAGAEIYADPLIVKVFYNLMDNAVRYGGRISTIRFSSGGRDGDRVIVCEDDGYGIPADEKEMIFERGYGKNTGLGLFLTREILGITGITVRETGEPGTGARFEITVPEDAYRITGQIPESAP
jgi:signal transduction histidine kinase